DNNVFAFENNVPGLRWWKLTAGARSGSTSLIGTRAGMPNEFLDPSLAYLGVHCCPVIAKAAEAACSGAGYCVSILIAANEHGSLRSAGSTPARAGAATL